MPELAQVALGNTVGDLVPGPALANSGRLQLVPDVAVTMTGPTPATSGAGGVITTFVDSINVVGSTISATTAYTVNATTTNLINQLTSMGYAVTAANFSMQVHGELALDLQVICNGMAGNMTTNIDLSTWTAWNRNLTAANVGTSVSVTTGTTGLISNPWPAWIRLQNQSLPQIQRTLEQQEADRAARARQQAEYTANQIKAEGEKAKARDRAAKLLQEQLTPKQREELAQKGFFSLEVLSATGKRIYRINKGRSRNVQEVDANGKVLKTLCAHPQIQCPDEDTMLTQKLMLEACEPEFLRVANIQTHH